MTSKKYIDISLTFNKDDLDNFWLKILSLDITNVSFKLLNFKSRFMLETLASE